MKSSLSFTLKMSISSIFYKVDESANPRTTELLPLPLNVLIIYQRILVRLGELYIDSIVAGLVLVFE